MKNKVKIMLVDDNETTNFLHKTIIKKEILTEPVYVAENGKQAIDYLKNSNNGKKEEIIKPNIIFLDLNMPVMDGWEFLDEYATLPAGVTKDTLLFILTTSPNPDDRKKADESGLVSGYFNKPLTPKMIKEILTSHFINDHDEHS